MTGSVLMEHLAATRLSFIERTGKPPRILALGRWDARELARYATTHGSVNLPVQPTPQQWINAGRGGMWLWEAEIKLDGRVGRMPGALWWHP